MRVGSVGKHSLTEALYGNTNEYTQVKSRTRVQYVRALSISVSCFASMYGHIILRLTDERTVVQLIAV